jgi:hypothetical protein
MNESHNELKKIEIKKTEIVDNKEELIQINNMYFNKPSENDLLKYLKKKLLGYKQQDIKKNKLDNDKFISLEKIVELLVISKLQCFYCKKNIKIKYTEKRDYNQWTLDRINNDVGHNKDNVKIACLECNLKRRRLNMDKFLFTKQLKIHKKE